MRLFLSVSVNSFYFFFKLADVKSRGFVLKGFINSDSRKGDEVELQTSIASVYGMRVFRGKNGSGITVLFKQLLFFFKIIFLIFCLLHQMLEIKDYLNDSSTNAIDF